MFTVFVTVYLCSVYALSLVAFAFVMFALSISSLYSNTFNLTNVLEAGGSRSRLLIGLHIVIGLLGSCSMFLLLCICVLCTLCLLLRLLSLCLPYLSLHAHDLWSCSFCLLFLS